MTDFTLTLTASPFASDQHERAQRFMAAALAQPEHRVLQVFFYQDAVLAALPDQATQTAWSELAAQANCPLYVCVSAAERRGIHNAQAPWEIVGLGDWVSGLSLGRHLQFGGGA